MSLSTEERIERLSLGISAVRIRLSKIGNPNHVKSGPQGGQFTSGSGGGGAATGAGATAPAKPVAPKTKPKAEVKPKTAGGAEAKPGGENIESTIRTSGVTSSKNLGGGVSGGVVLVTLADGSKAVFKPASGEPKGQLRPGVSVGKATEREVGAWEVAKLVGMKDLATPAVERTIGGQRGAVLAFQKGEMAAVVGEKNSWDGNKDLTRSAVFDYVIGNADRHAGNWLVDGGKLKLIDHSLAFPTGVYNYTSGNAFLIRQTAVLSSGAAKKEMAGHYKEAVKAYAPNKAAILSSLKKAGLPEASIRGVGERIDALGRAKVITGLPGVKSTIFGNDIHGE